MQARFDTVMVVASENLDWGNAEYELLALKANKWTAFKYTFDDMSPARLLNLPTKEIDSFNVEQQACYRMLSLVFTDSILKMQDIDTIACVQKTKQGYSYPEISDANTVCVYLLTKATAYKKSYYAPGFYEGYCHNKFRKKFLRFVGEVKKIAGNRENWY